MRPLAFTAIVISLAASGPALSQGRAQKAEAVLIAKSPTEIAQLLEIDGADVLDLSITISTQPVYRVKYADDHFLRAIIYKDSGRTVFQVYRLMSYSTDTKAIDSATYETPDGPVEVEADTLRSEITACSSRGRCGHRDDVVFDVPEALLRRLSAGATGGTTDSWRYKLAGRFGPEEAATILKTEIAGLLIGVDAVRKRYAIPTTVPAPATPSAAPANE